MQLARFLPFFATVAVVIMMSAQAHNSDPQRIQPIKKVEGKVFDRIISIWLENVDFTSAIADPNLLAISKQGLLLTNYYASTHPSEPNYVSSVGGDYFGIDSDDLLNLPSNVSSVVDLLEDKDISWAEYQEDMPSTGFTGFQFLNQETGANDYVRKHNPLVIYTSVNGVPERLANIKNFTLFQRDLAANALPQWMFITPNMSMFILCSFSNDGHDTNVTFAGTWSRTFLEPLLKDPKFNDERTLILLSTVFHSKTIVTMLKRDFFVAFDENLTAPIRNNVYAVLLGNAVPKNLIGKTDDNFYTHYSTIATVSANWGLHTLGRWDVGSNVFEFVAKETGDKIRTTDIDNIEEVLFNASYPGIFNSVTLAKQPIPNTRLVVNGRTVLPSIQRQWESQVRCTVYNGELVPPSLLDPPILPRGC
ncbi:hypothetical protein H0H92_002691 [Tricholoma furcatifolium]|nr:hypothetical protein H0H92_002691 [Tricholoma furcatifolium]